VKTLEEGRKGLFPEGGFGMASSSYQDVPDGCEGPMGLLEDFRRVGPRWGLSEEAVSTIGPPPEQANPYQDDGTRAPRKQDASNEGRAVFLAVS
jgi:hypothetical protein